MDVFGFRVVVRHGGGLLPRAGRGACGVQAAGRALPRLHRHPQGERLPVAAHGAVRAVRLADRGADPHRGDGPDRRARHRRALGLQDGGTAAATARRAARTRGSPTWWKPSAAPVRRWSSWRTSRSTCSPTRSTCSRRRATSCRCRATPPRSTSPTRCIPTSATMRWPRAWTSRLVPLRTKLVSGQSVEIITAKSAVPTTAVAGVRGHQQGAHRDPPAAQATGARGRGAAGPPHARPRAGARRAPRWTASRCRGWRPTWPTTATRGWRRCWPTSRWATACRRRWRWRWRSSRAAAAAAGRTPRRRSGSSSPAASAA